MTGIEHDICDTQGRIYEYASTFGYDMEVFSKAYLCSDFCHRAMDAPYSRFIQRKSAGILFIRK